MIALQQTQVKVLGSKENNTVIDGLDMLYKTKDTEIYLEEAEQSRLMMAISAGNNIFAKMIHVAIRRCCGESRHL